MMHTRNALLWAALLLLYGCGGGGSSSPAPAAGGGAVPAGITIGGVAAGGLAIPGANVSITDGNNDAVDSGVTVTGTDGSYSVEVPPDAVFPLIITITPAIGDPLVAIVPAAAGAGTAVVANVNPVTSLVADSVLGGATTPAEIAAALAPIAADPTQLDTAGNAVVSRLFGGQIAYSEFGSDPGFVAQGSGATPTPADTLLDVLARRASAGGQSVKDFIAAQAAAPNPPRLLEDPAFQADYVVKLLEVGNPASTLVATLEARGAITPLGTGATTDLFREIIRVLPDLADQVVGGSATLTGNPALAQAARAAVGRTVGALLKARQDSYGDSGDELTTLLGSSALQNTLASVVSTTVVPVLERVNPGEVGNLIGALGDVVDRVADETGQILSSFNGSQLATTNVDNLVTTYVNGTVIPADIDNQIANIAAGTATAGGTIGDTGTVNDIQSDLTTLVTNDPDLINGDVTTVLEPPPAGWDSANWDEFNWA